jgi:hypothetical protein
MARQKTTVKVYQQGKDGIIHPTEIGEAQTLAEAMKIPNENGVFEYHRVIKTEVVEVENVKKIKRETIDE